MDTRDISNFSVQKADTPPTVSPRRKRDFLIEWRSALAAIVERDPEATETRKTIVEIDEQIASLEA